MTTPSQIPNRAGTRLLSVLLVSLLGLVSQPVLAEDGLDARQAAKILENIRPVGQVNVGGASAQAQTAAPAPAAASARSGADVYNGACMACHGTGAAGAPKVGDKAAWGPRAEMGVDGLLKSAVSGLNAMPPRGTCGDCSDDELKAAIEHMLKETGLL